MSSFFDNKMLCITANISTIFLHFPDFKKLLFLRKSMLFATDADADISKFEKHVRFRRVCELNSCLVFDVVYVVAHTSLKSVLCNLKM